MSTNYYDAENNKLIPIAGIGKFPADYGTKAEFETKKDSLPVGTVFTTTDEFEDFFKLFIFTWFHYLFLSMVFYSLYKLKSNLKQV